MEDSKKKRQRYSVENTGLRCTSGIFSKRRPDFAQLSCR